MTTDVGRLLRPWLPRSSELSDSADVNVSEGEGIMDENVKHFLVALQHQGVDVALTSLNALTPCRFTGIFELVGSDLLSRHLVDKRQEPRSPYLDVVPFADSFCQIALREGEFRSINTTHDRRLDYSPYQGHVVSYHAVPLLDRALVLRGTLCHFDLVETALDDYQFALMRQAARILPLFLYGPGLNAPTHAT